MPTMLWMFSILIDQWYSKGRIFEFCNHSKEKQILFADSFFPDTNLIGGGKKPRKIQKATIRHCFYLSGSTQSVKPEL